MVVETNDLVNDLLSILQPTEQVVPEIKETVRPKKEKIASISQPIQPQSAVLVKTKLTTAEVSHDFLNGIDDSETSTHRANVYISQDVYEIFVSLKRAKKIKNVTILLNYALKDFIKRNAPEIKTLMYDSKNNEIL